MTSWGIPSTVERSAEGLLRAAHDALRQGVGEDQHRGGSGVFVPNFDRAAPGHRDPHCLEEAGRGAPDHDVLGAALARERPSMRLTSPQASKLRCWARMAVASAVEMFQMLVGVFFSATITRRSGSDRSLASTTEYMMLKTAVVAPRPRPSTRIAVRVKPGLRRRPRSA